MGTMQQVIDDIRGMPHIFDLDRNNLGDRVAVAAANGIMATMDLELDPDLIPWPSLDPLYEQWKAQHYPGQPIAVLLAYMKDLSQLIGTTITWPTLMRQDYGIDENARLLAEFFQDPPSMRNQPPRKFYELGVYAIVEVDLVFTLHFLKMIP